MLSRRTLVHVFAAASLVAACSSDPAAAPAGDATAQTKGPGGTAACTDGATRCEGDAVATCTVDATGALAFGAAEACGDGTVCRDGACAPVTAAQKRQAQDLADMLAYLRDRTAWGGPIDWTGLESRGRAAIFHGDGSDRTAFSALFDAFITIPEGHQGLFLDGQQCGAIAATSGWSQRGVCGRPHARGVIVTNARAGNPLGLARGDLVVGVRDGKDAAVLDALAARPVCTASRPSRSFRDASTAATFADLLAAGETIEVEAPDGTRRSVVVPAAAAGGSLLSCQDPLGRDTRKPVEATTRPDGVAVIRLPGFTDPEQAFPTDGTEASYDAYREAFEAKIQAAFDSVKTARAIVWDVRGNPGGLTAVGLAIASGFPGARDATLSYCTARTPGTSPPAFGTDRYATYALTPGGRFAYAGKVAVLTDGLDYSASDYFALATKLRTSAVLVGAGTAGGFGATSDTRTFKGPPGFSVAVDANHCVLADGDAPLEGKSVEPAVAVGYEPADLVAGRDTPLERAVAELAK